MRVYGFFVVGREVPGGDAVFLYHGELRGERI